jgi:hypothetical protein
VIQHGRSRVRRNVDRLSRRPADTAGAIAASSWCPGCLNGMYVVGVVPKVQADFATYAAL